MWRQDTTDFFSSADCHTTSSQAEKTQETANFSRRIASLVSERFDQTQSWEGKRADQASDFGGFQDFAIGLSTSWRGKNAALLNAML